ncbi:hypothetical protein LINPERHAP1_LOCUS31787 [Linum perenne]
MLSSSRTPSVHIVVSNMAISDDTVWKLSYANRPISDTPRFDLCHIQGHLLSKIHEDSLIPIQFLPLFCVRGNQRFHHPPDSDSDFLRCRTSLAFGFAIQDPNKKIIKCDEKLKKIFAGKDEVGFLEIAGLISPHFLK